MAIYTKTTKDDTVSDIKDVRVKKTFSEEHEEELTLNKLDTTINAISKKIAIYTTRMNKLKAIRKEVEKEAKKVKLYVKEEIDELID